MRRFALCRPARVGWSWATRRPCPNPSAACSLSRLRDELTAFWSWFYVLLSFCLSACRFSATGWCLRLFFCRRQHSTSACHVTRVEY